MLDRTLKKKLNIYIFISLLASLSPLTQHTILPTVVNIQKHFSLQYKDIIYIFSISTFAMALMHLVYGYLSDNFGRKKIILFALRKGNLRVQQSPGGPCGGLIRL